MARVWKSTASAPGSRWILVAGFLLLLQMGIPYAYALLRPSLVAEFGLDEVRAALPFSLILVSYTVGMLLGGVGSDRFGPRRVGVVGSLLFAGGTVATGLAPTFSLLLLSYGAVCGFGIGLGYMAAVTAAVRHHPRRRGMATGCVVLGFGLATAIFSPLLHKLIEIEGWRDALVQLGVAFLLLTVPLAASLRFPDPAADRADAEPAEPERFDRRFLAAWIAWALVLTVGLAWLGQLAEIARRREMPEDLIPWLMSAVAVANGFARPLLGMLSDRIGRFRVLAMAAAIGSGAVVLPLAWSGPGAVWVSGIAIGLCFGGWLVNMAPVSAEAFGGVGMGRVYGILFTSYGLAALAGPIGFGALRAVRPDDTLGLLASAALLALAAIGFARLGVTLAPQMRAASARARGS